MIRSQPAAPVRAVYVGGPRDGREPTLEVPGGISTIVNVDDPLGVYVRASFLPDGGWRLAADLPRVRRRRGMSGSGDRRIVPGSAPDATISHRQALVGRASGAAFSVEFPSAGTMPQRTTYPLAP